VHVFSGMEYENLEKESQAITPVSCDPDLKAKIHKSIRELDRLVSLFEKKKGSSTLAISMDRLMTEIRRTSVQVLEGFLDCCNRSL